MSGFRGEGRCGGYIEMGVFWTVHNVCSLDL